MIRELINFTKSLDEDFKYLEIKPKEGLHILLELVENNEQVEIKIKQYGIYSNKMNEISEFLYSCALKSENSWMINANKCFEKGKGIHSCSPYCVAFKKIFFSGGGDNVKNKEKNKRLIPERIEYYFDRAFELFTKDEDKNKNIFFKEIFTKADNSNFYLNIIKDIKDNFKEERKVFFDKIIELKKEKITIKDKDKKEKIKSDILKIENQLLSVKEIEDNEYLIFYLEKPLEKFKEVHSKYLSDKLFNKDIFNTPLNENNQIFGVSGFLNSIDSGGNKPFWLHQTASFNITGRISNEDAKNLNDLYAIFTITKPNILPRPLPIFIFKEELQGKVIGLFKESGFKLSYREIIEKLWDSHKDDFNNYYLMYWYYGKGIVIQDFDFVSQFEYELEEWELENLFELKDSKTKNKKYYPKLKNIFDLEQIVFKKLISNKFDAIDYFKDLDIEDYKDYTKNKHSDNTFYAYSKYRKGVYDYIYKSKRQAIDRNAFEDIVFSGIKDDLKQNDEYGIKEKLNIWFNLNSKFTLNKKNKSIDMASKLKDYQQFVDDLAEDKANVEILTDEQFAFAAGQVIDYILKKSKSADQSYKLLEPYLQQSKCEQFKAIIANDFARYKHENYSNRFKAVTNDVLSYETDADLKKLLPEILSGIFSTNQLFSSKKDV